MLKQADFIAELQYKLLNREEEKRPLFRDISRVLNSLLVKCKPAVNKFLSVRIEYTRVTKLLQK